MLRAIRVQGIDKNVSVNDTRLNGLHRRYRVCARSLPLCDAGSAGLGPSQGPFEKRHPNLFAHNFLKVDVKGNTALTCLNQEILFDFRI